MPFRTLVVAAALAAACLAGLRAAPVHMPIGEVRPGMVGVGRTVFGGDRIDEFKVHVIGVMRNVIGPRRNLILAKLEGGPLADTGVIAGMSGSPVYIDGRLVGAVSYRFGSFSKEPIAGITPIESMLDLSRDPDLPKKLAGGAPLPGKAAFRLSALRSRSVLPAPSLSAAAAPAEGQLAPIATPVMLGGFPPAVTAALERELAQHGLIAVAGASTSGKGKRKDGRIEDNRLSLAGGQKAGPILPASAISVMLMRGDFDVAGTGTVSFVEDALVLAFGHPFFGYGNVAFPMHTAAILNTLASLSGSYKMSAAGLEVGAITHDRLSAIGGRLGQAAPMIPAIVRVRGETAAAPAIEAKVEIVDHDLWFPVMLSNAVNAAVHGRISAEAGGSADLTVRYQVGDKTLVFKDSYSVLPPFTPGALAAQDVGNVAGFLVRNGIARPALGPVEVDIQTRSSIELDWLEALSAERTVVRAGEKVKLHARLRPYREQPITVPLEIQIPKDARGEVEIFVGGSAEMDQRDDVVWGDRYLEDIDDLLGYVADRRSGRGLYARVYLKRPGLRMAAELMSSLPPSQRLGFDEDAGGRHRPIVEAFGPEATAPVPAVVVGGLTIKILVQDP
jgi:hypothetical protein